MTSRRWWLAALGLALAGPALVFGSVFLHWPVPVSTFSGPAEDQARYVATFSNAPVSVLGLLPVLGLLTAWAAPVVGIVAWRRQVNGKQPALLAAALGLLSVPAVLLTLLW